MEIDTEPPNPTPTGRVTCTYEGCGVTFVDKCVLATHIRTIHGERSHFCKACNFSCYNSHSLDVHTRTHTGERPYICEICKQAFSTMGGRNSHMTGIHTDVKKHACSLCDYKTYVSGNLAIHKRTHTGEKPYLCNVCPKTFSMSSNLTRHMKIHSGKKTHKCDECNYACYSSNDIEQHKRTHTGEKPFVCNGCDRAFSVVENLSRHMKIHERDAQRDMAPMEDHHVLETTHSVQSWER